MPVILDKFDYNDFDQSAIAEGQAVAVTSDAPDSPYKKAILVYFGDEGTVRLLAAGDVNEPEGMVPLMADEIKSICDEGAELEGPYYLGPAGTLLLWNKISQGFASSADGAIKEVNIADGAVTKNKIAANAVNGSKIADNAVNGSKIADNSVSKNKLDQALRDFTSPSDWVVNPSGIPNSKYRKLAGFVEVVFSSSSVTISADKVPTDGWVKLFTLPVGMRPDSERYFTGIIGGGTATQLYIPTNGEVQFRLQTIQAGTYSLKANLVFSV